ncbi:MAG: shikimate dehydrogenase [Deltaproteobacteria bacterium]|nr:shikimate dehydrogenase [Candidatus Zymogenaceae bacterium]
MSVSAQTRLFCLLGDPVSHSKSPAMMNAAFAAAGIDGVYLALHTPVPALGFVMEALRRVGCGGLNVTAPHKQAVIPFVDELAATARQSGSVNTVVFDNGRLVGHSTDGEGLVGALEQGLGVPIRGKTILIFGAGGAARGVLPALAARGAQHIAIANRSAPKAEALVGEFGAGPMLRAIPLTASGVTDALIDADIVINATALPVTSTTFLDIDLSALRQGAVLFDMNYGRPPSEVGRVLARRSVIYSDGLAMLLFQGARAFTLWTKQEPPLAVMRAALGL